MPMRSLFLPAAALALGLLAATGAAADDQSQLIESINAYPASRNAAPTRPPRSCRR